MSRRLVLFDQARDQDRLTEQIVGTLDPAKLLPTQNLHIHLGAHAVDQPRT